MHPLGAGKVQVAERLAEALGIDLSVSVAYADRFSDVPLLERVGEPVAVNPDRALRRYASQRGWRVLRWR
ncbi:MAG: hypothetical protein KatS3mg115_0592 [Candidatus Poribacteria bacterium]|nr:MAG: hypothetical protein KatS3mg115_0592 [Candidatus Poribacteria bacterium]